MAEEKPKNPDAKLKLKNIKVVFFNPEDEGFGTTITIDCTEPEVESAIVEWVKKNNIGKDNPGVAKIKEYAPEGKAPTKQFAFKINEFTKYAGINGLGKGDIGYGSIVDLIANSFSYANKFTGGKERVGQSVSAVVVKSGASTGGDSDLAELLGEVAEEPDKEIEAGSIPF